MGVQENKCEISQNDILHVKFSEFYLCFHNSYEIWHWFSRFFWYFNGKTSGHKLYWFTYCLILQAVSTHLTEDALNILLSLARHVIPFCSSSTLPLIKFTQCHPSFTLLLTLSAPISKYKFSRPIFINLPPPGWLIWESAGLLSGRSRVQTQAGPTLRVLKITEEKVLPLQWHLQTVRLSSLLG